jgi:hypothetical protein
MKVLTVNLSWCYVIHTVQHLGCGHKSRLLVNHIRTRLRIWACVEDPKVKYQGPILGRIYYALSFYPIVDIISILPNWISMISYVLDPFFTGEQYIESPDFTTAGMSFAHFSEL